MHSICTTGSAHVRGLIVEGVAVVVVVAGGAVCVAIVVVVSH